MRVIRNIISGLDFQAKREAKMAYYAAFDDAWSKHFHAWQATN